ncbi:MAG: HAD family phosphatase [Nitrosopumilus sp. B06]|nr:MAG: HAD family phosphatase [Nitrosopumilus sp. B06]
MNAIKRNKRKFPKMTKSKKYHPSRIIVCYPDDYFLNTKNAEKLQKKYGSLPNVVEAKINQAVKGFKSNISTKSCHFFFDVDSTLTEGDGVIQNKVRGIFAQMKNDECRVYLASGRDVDQLGKDIKDLGAERRAIAENGGILIGVGPDGQKNIGNKKHPDTVSAYMRQHCKKIKEDIGQGVRETERIFKATIPEKKFLEYVKKSRANVSVLASKNSYHVTEKNINKGHALERLKNHLKFGTHDLVIAVGDSDLDVPMMKKSHHAFAVGNASLKARRAGIHLGRNYADGVEEMYERWFKR